VNYTQLVQEVSSYLENTFATADMNTFIEQCEARVYNTVQIPVLRKNVTGTITANNKYLSCPTDFLSTYSIAVISPTTGEYTYLVNKDVNFIREAYPSPTATGVPRYYAIFGQTTGVPNELSLILGPTPNATYSTELHYFYYPESIVTAGTTWLGDNYDPVLLYGTLVEAYTFLKGESDMMQVYVAKYTEAMQQLKRLGDGLERSDAYRNGQARVGVP
jgi:hypothetical protein